MRLGHDDAWLLLGAFAVDACDEHEGEAVEAHLADCESCRDELARLAEAAGWLGGSDAEAPPVALRAAVLGDSSLLTSTRPRRTAEPQVALYAEQVAALDALLGELTPAAWQRPVVIDGWTVHDLVSHLAATEVALAAALTESADGFSGRPLDDRTYSFVDRHRDLWPAVTATEWRDAADVVLRIVAPLGANDLNRTLGVYDTDWPLSLVLTIRAFEIWIHAEDIRRAAGLPSRAPSEASLTVMTEVAVEGLTGALAMSDKTHPGKTAWVVLRGAGGGSWRIPLAPGEAPGTPDVVLAADAVEFCLRAGDRIAADALSCDVEGDTDLGRDLLEVASAFARL